MLEQLCDEFYYISAMNENYSQPSLVAGSEADILKGLYRFDAREAKTGGKDVRLVGSGAILREVIAAADLLEQDFGISSEIFSATSFSELPGTLRKLTVHGVRNGRYRAPKSLWKRCCLEWHSSSQRQTMCAYPQLIAPFVSARFVALGTDGFGRSDNRTALRSFFEVDRFHVVLAALEALVREGKLERTILLSAIQHFGVNPETSAPWKV